MKGCVLPSPGSWLKPQTGLLRCRWLWPQALRGGGGGQGCPEDKGGRVKSIDIIPTLLDLSLILRASVQETQPLLESSVAEMPRGKSRAYEDWKGLLCAGTVLGAFADVLLVTLSAF